MSASIATIKAREILDSRGNPTVETTVILSSGAHGTASVPSGASKGSHEAVELRDKDPHRYGGEGVLRAVDNVNTTIEHVLHGVKATDQTRIDRFMLNADGTENKSKLGANAILSVSLAAAVAASVHEKKPLYKYLNQLYGKTELPTTIERMPTPTFNVINGGKHGGGNLNFQEFHVLPSTKMRYHDALELGTGVYDSLKDLLVKKNLVHSTGDEGGFAPNLDRNRDALDLLKTAVKQAGYKYGTDCFFGLDVAAEHFKTDGGYKVTDRKEGFTLSGLITFLSEIVRDYGLVYLEDPLEEDAWAGWQTITKDVGAQCMVVGDDLLATNPRRLIKAIETKSCNAILLKPNQIGTLSEYFDVIRISKENYFKTIVSHRSGETNDTFVADLAVAVQADYVKFGAPARGERVAKYNRLLEIESELFS